MGYDVICEMEGSFFTQTYEDDSGFLKIGGGAWVLVPLRFEFGFSYFKFVSSFKI